ncbi:putative ribonuclease H-like domain-containing protein [Tanacetum coccineum]
MNYEPVTTGNQTNKNAGIKDNTQQYILLPLLYDSPQSSEDAVADDAGKKTNVEPANEGERNGQEKEGGASNKEDDQNVDSTVSTTGQIFNTDDLPTDPLMPDLEDTVDLLNTGIFIGAYDDEDVGAEADLNNLETTMNINTIPTTRIHKDHPKDQIIRDINLATQIRRMTKIFEEHAMVYRNKKDERGIVVRNKARLVAQGYTQEEGINYDEVFAPVDRIEAIRLFLAYASFMGFIVYQMDVKSAFLYGTIEEEVYIFQPPGFQVQQKEDRIFISQDKHVADILKEFDFINVKTTSTPIETNKALLKDEEAEDVDVHLYGSMIGSLMYLTASRSDIMFAVCACARFQVTPKVLHLHAIKRIFRYLKGQPKLGLWYPRDSPFDLEAFLDSDYAGASLDRKSTTGATYVAAANCCGQVLWIQNQMLDYGFNFMNTKIYVDNESTIYIVKNLVFHSKTKHIEIRHHFIRDSYEKRLIQVIKIHTDHNVADLLINAFDVSRDSIRDKLGDKTGSCKDNAARQDFVLLGKREANYVNIQSRMDGRTCNIKQKCVKSQTPRQAKRGRYTKIPQSGGPLEKVGDEAVHKELGGRMERAATTTSSLEAGQDSGNINRTQSIATLNEPSP